MPTIKFMPQGTIQEYQDGESIFEVGTRVEAGIETACVGKGTCGLCRVRMIEGGEFAGPHTDEELKHLGNVYFLTQIRLSCRTRLSGGDVVVELAPKRKQRANPGNRRARSARGY